MLFKLRNAVHCTVLCYVWFGKLLLYCDIGLYWYFKSIPINTGQYSGFDHTLYGTDFSPLCSPLPLLPLLSSVDFVKWSSQGMLRMSPDAMNSLFKPTIDHIIQHLSKLHWSFPQHLNTHHTHTHTQVVSKSCGWKWNGVCQWSYANPFWHCTIFSWVKDKIFNVLFCVAQFSEGEGWCPPKTMNILVIAHTEKSRTHHFSCLNCEWLLLKNILVTYLAFHRQHGDMKTRSESTNIKYFTGPLFCR